MKKSELPDTLEVLKDICTLIIEVRSASKECKKGREEGVHCKAVLQAEARHICNPKTSFQCQRILELQETLTPLLCGTPRDTTFYIDTVASQIHLGDGFVTHGNSELLIERWTIRVENVRNIDKCSGGARLLLLQAIHSHLHFSQLSAWLSSTQGRFPDNVAYRVNYSQELDFKLKPDEHRFPIIEVGEGRRLVVVVNSLPRSGINLSHLDARKALTLDFGNSNPSDREKYPPQLKPPSSIKSPSSCSQQAKQKLVSDMSNDTVSVSNGDVCLLSTASQQFSKFNSLHDSGIFSPGILGKSYNKSSSLIGSPISETTPTFILGDENSLDSDIMSATNSPIFEAYRSALPDSPTPFNSPIHSVNEMPLRSTPYPWPISQMFTFNSPEKWRNIIPASDFEINPPNFEPVERDLQPRALTSSPTPSSSSNIPEPLESLTFSPIKFDSPMKCKAFHKKGGSQRRSTSLCIEEEYDESSSSLLRETSTDDIRASWHGNPFIDKPDFKRSTSLPLLSSPVMYRKSSGRKNTSSVTNKPNKKCLLGSFEESILKDRFYPSGSISGFKFKMSVSGLFSSPSITLPFTGNFYNLSECPSPYTGSIKLDTCGTHGYLLSKQGRIQATILDPENSVIRIFLVPYDVRDMPPRSQTFVRQRIHSVTEDGKKTLQYHIHFRLMSGRSNKVYLHTDIRVLFVRGTSSISTADMTDTSGVTMVTENCIPLNPRYSTISKTKRSR